MPDVGAPPGAPMFVVIGILIGLGVGAALAFVALYALTGSRLAAARRTRQLLLTEARRDAEAMGREAQIEAREQSVKLRAEVEQEVSDRRAEIIKIEERVLAKEDEIDRKLTELTRREQGVSDRETHSKELQEKLKEAKEAELKELERISSMTTNEAKAHLLSRSEELIRHELARRVRQMEEEAQTEAKRRARNLVADALQRVAANHASETTVSLVELPSDDMKGRIIGREGRNIRTLEHLTGVDFIIDDTPQAVVLSSFDGIRREIAKLTLAKLIEDGRIHPARIEEMYYQSKAEIEEHIVHAGEQAVFEANCGPPLRRERRGSARDPGASLRGSAPDRGGGAPDRCRCRFGVPSGCPRRESRALHQAPGDARGAGFAPHGCREGLRPAGRPRDPRDREAEGGRRRPGRAALARDRPRDRGPARIPRPDQGDRDPGEPGNRRRQERDRRSSHYGGRARARAQAGTRTAREIARLAAGRFGA